MTEIVFLFLLFEWFQVGGGSPRSPKREFLVVSGTRMFRQRHGIGFGVQLSRPKFHARLAFGLHD
jgi:hypothetical protein